MEGGIGVPRSTQDFIPNSAKRRNFVFGGERRYLPRSVVDGHRIVRVEERADQWRRIQGPQSAEGASERGGNFLKLRLLNLISRCADASA